MNFSVSMDSCKTCSSDLGFQATCSTDTNSCKTCSSDSGFQATWILV